MFWEERGLGEFGGKELVRNQLGIICAGAATVAPCLVTAAVPRDLRVDPCERKSKETSLALCDKGALLVVVVDAGLVNMAVLPSTPETKRRSSQKCVLPDRGRSPIF